MSRARTLPLELPIESEDELRALRGALLAARATELSELERRAGRHSFGYGSDSARETMTEEVASHRLRVEMLDRLVAAIDLAMRG
ncbi:MAG TPA: hypothetical protein VFI34_11650 [Candidatus Limnocylindrales bacterium]|nr:hypothetical protein [Candidatus Limnocylindrales bacterium]